MHADVHTRMTDLRGFTVTKLMYQRRKHSVTSRLLADATITNLSRCQDALVLSKAAAPYDESCTEYAIKDAFR